MRPVLIALPATEVHIRADRRLAFQVLTAWGAAGPDGKPVSRVLREEGAAKLIEFQTTIRGLFGRGKVYTTQEWVTVVEPERISFRGYEGPLAVLRDELVLEAVGPCTCLRYESAFALGGWYLGWVLGKLYVAPVMKRFMREHLGQLKQTIEARADRSTRYPQQCTHGG